MIKCAVGMNACCKRSQIVDGNSQNNFFPVCEDAELWEYFILCDLNKVKRDEWLLKLEIKLNKTQNCKRIKEKEERNFVK